MKKILMLIVSTLLILSINGAAGALTIEDYVGVQTIDISSGVDDVVYTFDFDLLAPGFGSGTNSSLSPTTDAEIMPIDIADLESVYIKLGAFRGGDKEFIDIAITSGTNLLFETYIDYNFVDPSSPASLVYNFTLLQLGILEAELGQLSVSIGAPTPGKANAFEIYEVGVGSAPVPEPATMLLLGSGLIGLARFRKKIFK